MSDIICITNRKLCQNNFFKQISLIVQSRPKAIILREKDMDEKKYASLSKEVISICKNYDVTCILHSFTACAIALKHDKIHLPLPLLRSLTPEQKRTFSLIGTSCHSIDEAKEAQKLGADYIITGHIFATDCKKDLKPRGTEFLKEIIENVSVPVYAIGGISFDNINMVRKCGASGVCIMSGFMKCDDITALTEKLKKGEQ